MDDNKFEIGTPVRVRKDLKAGEFYDGLHFNSNMFKYVNIDTFISNVIDKFYTIDCDKSGYYFNAMMLEKI